MKVNILESQYDLLIAEAENVAFLRKNAKAPNLKAIWSEIDRKQKELQAEVFGELSEKMYDITVAKAEQMGERMLEVPRNMFTAGNSKLPSSILIVNMSSSLMCPSYYLGICTISNGACYAQRAENQYSAKDRGSVLSNRWKSDLMHTQMLQQYQNKNKKPMQDYFNLVETYIQLGNAYATNLYRAEVGKMEAKLGRELTDQEREFIKLQQNDNKITDIRLNETGDFQCQLAVDLWDKFAAKMKKKYGISTHAYTARNLDFSNVKNIAINPSHEGINLGNKLPRRFQAVSDKFFNSLTGGTIVKDRQPQDLGEKKYVGNDGQPILDENGNEKVTYYYKCPCTKKDETCDRCGVCFDVNKTGVPYTIYVRYHGMVADGFKNLFKKNEVENVIEKLHYNGWITDKEYASYTSDKTQTFLDNVSTQIQNQRDGKTPPKKNTKKKKSKAKPKTKKNTTTKKARK